jgi:hypothetical protein
MTNQVTFEGYVVRVWTHDMDRFMRLANHRPANQGGPIPQNNMVYSDYTTIRLDSSIEFDPERIRPGTRVVVRGRIEGRDIPETLGEILMHCNVNLQLPMNIANVVVTRPITQVFAATLDIKQWHPDRRPGRRENRHRHPANRVPVSAQGVSTKIETSAAAIIVAPVPEPGQDLAELIVEPALGNDAKVEENTARTLINKTK